ncbi:MAG: S8 family serine peptidase [Flavobacteriales bacterium]|nr:S8 family serine peptidase [Flavobacteriales bacterium]
MKHPLLSFLTVLLLAASLKAQQPMLHLRTGTIAIAPLDGASLQRHFDDAADAAGGRLLRCLLFDHNLGRDQREVLSANGVRFLSPLKPHAWAVSLPQSIDASIIAGLGLKSVHAFTAEQKLDPRLRDEMASDDRMILDVVVVPWKGEEPVFNALVDRLAAGSRPYGSQGARIVQARTRDLLQLLSHPWVQWMEPLPEPGEPEDLRGRAYHRVNRLGPVIPNGSGLDGNGVVVVVNDDGYVGPHIDFKGRTEQSEVAADTVGTHGDMVAGIVGAAGNIDPHGVGMAPGCDLTIAPYFAELPLTVTLHQSQGAVIFNSSYANGCNAGYTALTQQVDAEVVANPSILQVFSAGNNGVEDCGYGAGAGWGNVTGGHKIGKNVIAAANLTDQDALIASSSRGPSADGRIKPDISSFGNGQLSNAPGNAYMTGSGTSAAAPGIAGVAALLYQGWRDTHSGADPPSGLIKAFLLNTADDLGNTGPDYKFGWGGVNAERAWRAIAGERWFSVTLNDGEVTSPQIDVPAGVAELRVMAYWTDPAGELLAANALVNDIDLAGISPMGDAAMPWSLSIAPDPVALNAPAIRADEHLNNVEQVMVSDPMPGTWTFPILGFDIPTGPQEVFIVYEFMPRAIDITWPSDGERLASDATQRIRWDTPDRSTPVTLRYSINGGGSWSSFNVNSGQRYFDLGIGDTVLTDLRVRVEQGTWADERTGITTMRTPVQLSVPVNCADSALFQWPPVQYAESYIVHKIGAQYMIAVDTISATSFWFTGLSAVHDDWFAVTAIAPGGIVGERSIAIARPHQLVACMAQQDLVVLEALSPHAPVIACQPQAPVTFVVKNAGLLAVSGFMAGVVTVGGVPFSAAFATTLQPGDVDTVTIAASGLGLVSGVSNTLKLWASALNEDFTPNDTLWHTLYAYDLSVQYPYILDMEAFTVCDQSAICIADCPLGLGLANGLEDAMDWRVDSAGTSSANTGPSVDHTLGTAQGHYVYMEPTGPCDAGEAHLLLPCFIVPAGTVGLTYRYHMLGAGIGSLHVDLLVDGNWQLDANAPVIGEQGDAWLPGFVDLAPYAGSVVNVRFRGVRGTSHLSDIALDDINISSAVGIVENGAPDALRIVPGASEGLFIVQPPQFGNGTISVRSATGALLSRASTRGASQFTLDLTIAAEGIYLVEWTDGVQRTCGRVVR